MTGAAGRLTRAAALPAALILTALLSAMAPARAEDWNDAMCVAEVHAARQRAAILPPGDLSRRFAEHDLATAILEMEAGDVDECEELVRRADEAVATRRYVLKPGQKLNGYGPDAPR